MRCALILLLYSLVFKSLPSQAARVVEVNELTDSRKTIVVKFGALDGLMRNEVADFVLVDAEGPVRIARGRAVKIYGNFSIWYLSKLYQRSLLHRGAKVKMLRRGELLSGLVRAKVRKNNIVLNKTTKKSLKDIEREKQVGHAPFMKNGGEAYEDNDVLEWKKKDKAAVKATKISKWTNSGQKYLDENQQELDRIYITALRAGPDEKKLADKQDLERFESYVQDYMGQGPGLRENPKKDWDKHYVDQKRDGSIDILPERGTRDNTYRAFLKEARRNKIRKEEVLRLMEQRFGESWTENLSDEELASFMALHGIYHEDMRKRRHLEAIHRFHMAGSFGFALKSHVINAEESGLDNSNALNYELAISGEYLLGDRYRFLKRVGLELSARMARDTVGVQTPTRMNASVSETTFMGAVLYYPFSMPNSIAANIVYGGIGFRNGWATLSSGQEQAEYVASSVPSFLLGMKYITFTSLGFKVQGSLEPMQLSSKVFQTGTALPESVSYTNIKLSIGIAYAL